MASFNLMDLPPEMHMAILEQARPREVFMLAFTCRAWRMVIVHQLPNKPQHNPQPSLWLMDRLMRKVFSTTAPPPQPTPFAEIVTELASTGCLCVIAFLASRRSACFATAVRGFRTFSWRDSDSASLQRLRLHECLRKFGASEAARCGHLGLLKWMIRNIKFIDPTPLMRIAHDNNQEHVCRFLKEFHP